MPKTYNETTIALLQKAIDNDEAVSERQEYGFVTRLIIAGVQINLYTDPRTGRKDATLNLLDSTTDTAYISIWKTFAASCFFMRDYKKQTRDSEGRCPYFLVKTVLAGVPVKAILRELFEDNAKLKEDYTDVTYPDGRRFVIIKICLDNPDNDLWFSGRGKISDIMHADYIDEVPGLTGDAGSNISISEDSVAAIENEAITTYF